MRSKLVAIGNSKGLRLPKSIREEARLEDDVDLLVEDGKLIVTPARRRRKARAGWEAAILEDIARNGPLEKADGEWLNLTNEWDEKGWK